MRDNHDFFIPEHIDEQIDDLSRSSHTLQTSHDESTGEAAQGEAALVKDLKGYYQRARQEDNASLDRAWERISAHLQRRREDIQPSQSRLLSPSTTGIYQERIHTMQYTVSHKGKLPRQLSLLVAVLVSALVVGGLVAVLNLSHHKGSGNATSPTTAQTKKTPTATATPLSVWGKTLYTTPASAPLVGYQNLSWSPNSKRVASVMTDYKGIQIWDALTGNHPVTIPLSDKRIYDMDWSPDGKYIAVATTMGVLIVNSQTGANVGGGLNLIAYNVISSDQTVARSPMGEVIPYNGVSSYHAVAWSPKGDLLAASDANIVKVWVPQTDNQKNVTLDAFNLTLSLEAGYTIDSLSWSSDGRFLAATALYQFGGAPTLAVAWDVTTSQGKVVFRNAGSVNGVLAWQPQSHNLAFVALTSSGGNAVNTLELWDAVTGKLVKQYTDTSMGGGLAWSPDGTFIAHGHINDDGNTSTVVILDAATGKQVYAYSEHQSLVTVIAWSPNGKYIVSGEGQTKGQSVAKVWTAA